MTTAELYVWKEPRPDDAAGAAALVEQWLAGDPSDLHRGSFLASDDVSWFHREITGDVPTIWNPDKPARDRDLPDRVVVVPLDLDALPGQLEDVYPGAAGGGRRREDRLGELHSVGARPARSRTIRTASGDGPWRHWKAISSSAAK